MQSELHGNIGILSPMAIPWKPHCHSPEVLEWPDLEAIQSLTRRWELVVPPDRELMAMPWTVQLRDLVGRD